MTSRDLPPAISATTAPFSYVIAVMAVAGFTGGLSAGLELPNQAGVNALVMLAAFVAVVLWLRSDGKRFPDVAGQYGGLGLYVFWPIVVPFYLVQSRGWRRALTLLFGAAVAFFLADAIGYYLGAAMVG